MNKNTERQQPDLFNKPNGRTAIVEPYLDVSENTLREMYEVVL